MYKLSVLRAGEYFAFLFYVMVNTSEKSSAGVIEGLQDYFCE